jgi:hypothetical protein
MVHNFTAAVFDHVIYLWIFTFSVQKSVMNEIFKLEYTDVKFGAILHKFSADFFS